MNSPSLPPMVSDAFITVAITLVLFLPLSAADLYLSADQSGVFPVNATMISFIALSCAYCFILFTALAHDRGRNLCSHYASAAPILLGLALLTIVQLSGGFLPMANWSGAGKFILLPLYSFVLFWFALGFASMPAFQRHQRGILAVCLLGAAGSIFIDAVNPQTFSKLATRPAGFEENPNHAATIAVILAIAATDWTRSRTGDMFLWLVAGLAVVATLSRGGMILLAIAFLHYIVVSARSKPNRVFRNISILLLAAPGVVALYSAADLGTTVYSSENDRVQLLATLLGGETASLATDSRGRLVTNYIELISERPMLGHGAGFVMSQAQGPHNMFLTLWVENGVLGLAAYLALLLVCFRYFRKFADLRGEAFCISLFVFSLFTHNLLTARPIIVTLGLLSGMAISPALAISAPARSAAACRLAGLRRLGRSNSRTHPARLARSISL